MLLDAVAQLCVVCVATGELPEQVTGHLQHPVGLPHLLRALHVCSVVHLHHPLPGVEEYGYGGRGHNSGGLHGHCGGRGYAPPLQGDAGLSNLPLRPLALLLLGVVGVINLRMTVANLLMSSR